MLARAKKRGRNSPAEISREQKRATPLFPAALRCQPCSSSSSYAARVTLAVNINKQRPNGSGQMPGTRPRQRNKPRRDERFSAGSFVGRHLLRASTLRFFTEQLERDLFAPTRQPHARRQDWPRREEKPSSRSSSISCVQFS